MDEPVIAGCYDKFVSALGSFTLEDPLSTLCTPSFYEDVGNDLFATGLDTLDNSLLHAKRSEQYVARLRDEAIRRKGAAACNALNQDHSFERIDVFNNSYSAMKYPSVFSE